MTLKTSLRAWTFVSWLSLTAAVAVGQVQVTVDFEELTEFSAINPAGGGSFYNGNDGSGQTNSDGWTSGGVFFNNNYDGDSLPAFDFWNGWAYSNVVNPTTAGFSNQYASIAGGGADGNGGAAPGENYAIAFGSDAYFDLPAEAQLESLDVTNTTYAALTMRDGDSFAKQFGGGSGDDPDYFELTLTGYDSPGASGAEIGSIAISLADYRFSDNSQDFIVEQWQHVDLTDIADARSVGLSFFSTDTGEFGINTPTYVAIDNLTYSLVPEPGSLTPVGLIAAVMALLNCSARNRPPAPVLATASERTG